MSSRTRIKQLGKDAIIYGFGGFFAKAIGFFLLPIYTRIFSPAEYGIIEMLTVVCSLLSAVLTIGMDSAQSFYFSKSKDRGQPEQAKIVTAILQWKIVWGGVVVTTATILSPLLNIWLFSGNLDLRYFLIAFVGALFTQIMYQSVEIYRLLFRPWSYTLLVIGHSLLSALVSLILIISFDLRILGYIFGLAGASAIMAVGGWYVVREYLNFSKIYLDLWPMLLKFGAPLLPASLAMYAMYTADRWFIQYYLGEEALGLFAIGAKFALLMGFIVEAFRSAWWPIAMDALHSDDGPETFRTIARLYLGLGVAGVVYLTFLSPLLLGYLVAEEYFEAYTIVGILAWQPLFYGFYLIAAVGLWKREKTSYVGIISIFTAILNIILNILLIPALEAVGAAIAASMSFFAWIIIVLICSEKLWYIRFPVQILFGQMALGMCGVVWILNAYNELYSWQIILVVTHILTGVLILSSFQLEKFVVFKRKLKI